MKDKFKEFLKDCLGFLCCIVYGSLVVFTLGDIPSNISKTSDTENTTEDNVYVLEVGKGTNDILKTVAHINLESRPELQLIYKDTENDIAYYRYIGERDLARVGDTVYTCYKDAVVITYCDIYGFRVGNPEYFQPGMSGTGIMDADGNIIGFVSESLVSDEVYCIWN